MFNKQTISNNLIPLFFFLGCIEFSAAAILILQIDPDPKNAILLGYSPSRLAIFILASVLALWLLALTGLKSYRSRVLNKWEAIFQKAPVFWEIVVFWLALLTLVILSIPYELLGKYGAYFERARPLLFVVCGYPVQFSLNWLIKRDWHLNRSLLKPVMVSLGILLALCGVITFSGLGVTPEQDYWNGAGNPITSLQVIIILFIGTLVFAIWGLIGSRLFTQRGKYLDLLIILALFAGTVFLWIETPIPHNEFSSRPMASSFQSFPVSDARIHDMGALAVLNGAGIFFRAYTDKPLYMVFLAILHIFAGYNYDLLSILQTCILALMVPFLYVLGKSFHSRLFGFVLAAIILVRQQNAILLSNVLNFNATPSQLLTEVPTLLGLIVFTCALFYWTRKPEKRSWQAFAAGSVLGAVSLIRLNPFLLVPITPVFLFLSLRHLKKEWFSQSLFFILGCALLILPWAVTGTDRADQSFFVIKFYDIINVRYGPGSVRPPERDMVFLHNPFATFPGQPQSAEVLPRLNAGPALPPIDIHTFPGFVINHTLHNFVGSFFTLPDSLQPTDQKLKVLIKRPAWSQGLDMVTPQQIPFMFLNLGLLAIGLGWSWKRWKWAGLSPLLVFSVYSLSLGFGRTSGARYLVPMDWGIYFYFTLGLLCLFQLLPQPFRHALQAEPNDGLTSQSAEQKPKWLIVGTVLLIFCVAALIPIAQKLIPPQKELCQTVNPKEVRISPPLNGAAESNFLVYGDVLYPEIKKGILTFGLLTCQQVFSFEITGFKGKLDIGQRVIAGLSDDSPYPHLEWIVLPPGLANSAQILWMAEPK